MMRTLLVGHRPGDDPAETIALAYAAALNGIGGDGRRMLEVDVLPSIADIASEAGLRWETARAALAAQEAAGAIAFEPEGPGRPVRVRVHAAALQARWADFRQRCRLPVQLRSLDLNPTQILIAGLTLGQRAKDGVCRIGLQFLRERTGLSESTIVRALRALEKAEAIKRWTYPRKGSPWPLLAIAEGPKVKRIRGTTSSGIRQSDPEGFPADSRGSTDEPQPAAVGQDSETSSGIRQSNPEGSPADRAGEPGDDVHSGGETPPDLTANPSGSDCQPLRICRRTPPDLTVEIRIPSEYSDQPFGRAHAREAPAAPAVVETGSSLTLRNPEPEPGSGPLRAVADAHVEQDPEPGSAPPRLQLVRDEDPPARAGQPNAATMPQSIDELRTVVEAWRLEHRRLDALNPANQTHNVAVAVLLDRIGWNVPTDIDEGPAHRQAARVRALRLRTVQDAARLCRWAGTAETLATWLLRAYSEHGPDNVCAYLREASAAGDPGTLLQSAKRNEIGRGAESASDYTAETEQALEGAFVADVAKLTAGSEAVLAAVDPEQRTRLRAQLARLLALGRGRDDGARRVLLELVGTANPPDGVLEHAIDGICSIVEARRLLSA